VFSIHELKSPINVTLNAVFTSKVASLQPQPQWQIKEVKVNTDPSERRPEAHQQVQHIFQ